MNPLNRCSWRRRCCTLNYVLLQLMVVCMRPSGNILLNAIYKTAREEEGQRRLVREDEVLLASAWTLGAAIM